MFEKKTILLTGVAGFIGSNFADRLLNAGYRVIGIDDLSAGLMDQVPPGVEFYKLDVCSSDIYSIFTGVDAVFHFAAKSSVNDCHEHPVETARVNVMGTVNVFEASKRAGVNKVIYVESSAVYEQTRVFPTPEEEERPGSFYASSKIATKYFADSYCNLHGLNTIGLRYFNVYGPKQDYRRQVPAAICAFIISMLSDRQPVIYGDGSKRRDFIYIDDVNDFNLKVLEQDVAAGSIFNVGTGQDYSILELYTTLAGLLHAQTKPEFRANLPGEAFQTCADITRAKNLGWQPKVSLQEGLKRTIEYIKKNGIVSLAFNNKQTDN